MEIILLFIVDETKSENSICVVTAILLNSGSVAKGRPFAETLSSELSGSEHV